MTNAERRGPLQDLTVIDFTRALAGPFGASLLADLGARVIKIEPPTDDGYRNIPPFLPDYAPPYEEAEAGTDFGAPFAAVNHNKRSVCLDLKDDAHKDVFLQSDLAGFGMALRDVINRKRVDVFLCANAETEQPDLLDLCS